MRRLLIRFMTLVPEAAWIAAANCSWRCLWPAQCQRFRSRGQAHDPGSQSWR